jgi:hypothetical protein
MSDTSSGRKMELNVELYRSPRLATMLLHVEAGRQKDLGGYLGPHFVARIALGWQIESCAGGDGLEMT